MRTGIHSQPHQVHSSSTCYVGPLKGGNALPGPFALGDVGDVGNAGAGGDPSEGEGGTSSYGPVGMLTSIPKSSMMPRGGGRSTIASRSCRTGRIGKFGGLGGERVVEIETGRTSRRRSSPAYSPSISSGPSNTVPLRNISPSSATQLFDLSSQSQTRQYIHPRRPTRRKTNIPVRRRRRLHSNLVNLLHIEVSMIVFTLVLGFSDHERGTQHFLRSLWLGICAPLALVHARRRRCIVLAPVLVHRRLPVRTCAGAGTMQPVDLEPEAVQARPTRDARRERVDPPVELIAQPKEPLQLGCVSRRRARLDLDRQGFDRLARLVDEFLFRC